MKNRTKILIGASVLLIALLSFRNCSCNRSKEKTKPVIANNNKLLTNPPIPGLDIPYQTFTINPGFAVMALPTPPTTPDAVVNNALCVGCSIKF
jgi:hypothetical protein